MFRRTHPAGGGIGGRRHLLTACLPNGRTQRLQIGRRVGAGKVSQGGVIGEQPFAPALSYMQFVSRLCRLSIEPCQPLADGRRIEFSHQSSDVLKLAALALMFGGRDTLLLADRVTQVLGHRHAVDLSGRQLHQSLAERLQFKHRLLAFSLARRVAIGQRVERGFSGAVQCVVALKRFKNERPDYAAQGWGGNGGKPRLPSVRHLRGLAMIAAFVRDFPRRVRPCFSTIFSFRSIERMASAEFAYSLDQLRQIASDVLAAARAAGASDCELTVSEGFGQMVSVRKGDIESIEHNRDKELGVGIYLGQRHGYASSSDFSAKALRDSVDAALAIARFTAEDEANGLPDRELIAKRDDHGDLDLFHPWAITVDAAVDIAKRCEAAAFRLDKRITNSEGSSVSIQQSQFISAHSAGFMGGFRSSRHYVATSVIAQEGNNMQRDDWYSSARSAADLASPEAIGDYAGRRALARLRGQHLKTRKVPVLFEAPQALGLIGSFIAAISGGNLYRKSSFLLDSIGTQVFPKHIQIREDPFVPRGMASGYFDDEGVATQARDIVRDGVVQGYMLSVYTARKLGMKTTGNAGGTHNLTLSHGPDDLPAMLKRLGTGLFVTDLMGQGVNVVTGDYSRGAAGFWVERGVIKYPVEEITIAGNLRDMLKNIVAVGADTINRGGRVGGSILLEQMTVAGSG